MTEIMRCSIGFDAILKKGNEEMRKFLIKENDKLLEKIEKDKDKNNE
jgi:hypothetical protein